MALNPPKKKGERTREMLKIAAAKMLEEQGYHDLRLRDITKSAGVAEGTIYAHFQDRDGVVNMVMGLFLQEFLRLHINLRPNTADPANRPELFTIVRTAIRRWFDLSRANSGLFRCMFQMSEDKPVFAAQVQDFNRQWSMQLSQEALTGRGQAYSDVVLLLTYAMKFMLAEVVRKLIVYPDRQFVAAVAAMGADDGIVADALSVIWVRTLYPDATFPGNLDAQLTRIIAWQGLSQGEPEAILTTVAK